jgi:polyhydroxybutyrate depolymerase
LAVLLGAACSTSAPVLERTEDFEAILEVDGMDRTYEVHLPTSYSPSVEWPVLLVLHGGGGRAGTIRASTQLDATADEHGFITAYPEALEGWVWDASFSDSVSDLAFIEELIERLDDYLSIDRERVYATGFSAGGFMSQTLACELTNRLAGVAVVAATLPVGQAEHCSSLLLRRRIGVMMINGTVDPLVPFEGDTTGGDLALLSVNESMDHWATQNRCDLAPDVTTVAVDDVWGVRTRLETYGNCDTGFEVAMYAMESGGHIWPTAFFPAANDSIAAFLLRQHR